MRPTTGPISHLTGSAEFRLKRLTNLTAGIALPLTPEKRRVLSYVAIEAANLWAQYSRCFFLSVAIGATDSNGVPIVTLPASSLQAAEDLAVHAIRPHLQGKTGPWSRRALPDWQTRGHLLTALKYVGASSYTAVDGALSYQTRVLLDLPTVRNFYAHKGHRAAQSVATIQKHYGITKTMSPHELLCTVPPTSADVLLNEWLDDISAIMSLMP